MTITKVVVNASPLIALFKSNQAELLPQLFQEIIIPKGVWDEMVIPGQLDAAAQMLPETEWINCQNTTRSRLTLTSQTPIALSLTSPKTAITSSIM